MRRIVTIAAFVSLLPLSVFALGSGMGMYGTASFGGGGGGNATNGTGREDYDAAIRLMDKSDYADAIPHLLKALRIQQGNADILNDLGYASRMAGDYDSAVDFLNRAISRNPDLKVAYTNLGQTYLAMHKPDQARLQLDQLNRLCPGSCEEKDVLSQSITAYVAADKSPAPPK